MWTSAAQAQPADHEPGALIGALMVVKVGRITPAVGMNVCIIRSMANDVPINETFIGIVPFLICDVFRITLLLFVPGIAPYALEVLK